MGSFLILRYAIMMSNMTLYIIANPHAG
ncbi:diacylglycerol kinase, partial [Streptococcus agalactiae]